MENFKNDQINSPQKKKKITEKVNKGKFNVKSFILGGKCNFLAESF